MSDNHEDPTGTHKPQRHFARALHEQFAMAKIAAAITRLLGDAGLPKSAQLAEDLRRAKQSGRNVFRWYESPKCVAEGGGERECARRARQIAAGKLHPYVADERLRKAA